MSVETKPVMHRLRPYSGAVTVIESAVDEEQRESGLLVPITADLGGGKLHRGVVLHVAGDVSGPLDTGTVVYFRRSFRIIDVLVVDVREIIAYEEDQ